MRFHLWTLSYLVTHTPPSRHYCIRRAPVRGVDKYALSRENETLRLLRLRRRDRRQRRLIVKYRFLNDREILSARNFVKETKIATSNKTCGGIIFECDFDNVSNVSLLFCNRDLAKTNVNSLFRLLSMSVLAAYFVCWQRIVHLCFDFFFHGEIKKSIFLFFLLVWLARLGLISMQITSSFILKTWRQPFGIMYDRQTRVEFPNTAFGNTFQAC